MNLLCLFRRHDFIPFYDKKKLKIEKLKNGDDIITVPFTSLECTKCEKKQLVVFEIGIDYGFSTNQTV